MMKTKTLQKDKVHVYFYALPVGTKFVHRGVEYVKTSDNDEFVKKDGSFVVNVIDQNWEESRFEGHYGCVLDESLADEIGIKKDEHRPLNQKL